MAKSLINLGTTPNDRTGDTLRDAGSKVNSNINELYTALGNGTTLQVSVTGATNGQVLKFNGTSFVPAADLNTDAVTSVNTKTGAVVLGTDDVAEGTTNKYYTDARARAAISTSGALSYNSTTGALTFTQGNTDTVAEGTNNLYYTSSRFNFSFSQKTTSDLTEGTNEYYTNAKARSSISVDPASFISYNNTTGVFSTPVLAPVALSNDYMDLDNLPTTFSANAIHSGTVPSTATSTGTAGTIVYDSGYVYICVATNTWKRAALATW